MPGSSSAAASLLTVTRTSSLPASCSARTCAAVASTSAVSVLVIDWTTSGWVPPTLTPPTSTTTRSEEHTSELQSRPHLVCRLLLEKKKTEIDNASMTKSFQLI